MKINPINNQGMLQSYKASRPVRLPENVPGQSRDEVTFSTKGLSFSKMLSEVRDRIETRPAEELQHIEDVARRVKDGTYSVRAEDIADKMIRGIIVD